MASGLVNLGKRRAQERIQEMSRTSDGSSGLVQLGRRRNQEKNQGGVIGGIEYVGANLGLGLASVGEGVVDLVQAGADLAQGDTDMAKYRFMKNVTGEAQERLQEDYNPGTIMKGAGDVASGIGTSLAFMIPYVGPYLAGTGFVGQGISGAAEKTGDVGLKEIGYGVVSGGLEFGLEALTAGMGSAAKNLGTSIIRKTGKEAVEATAKATGKSAAKLAAGKLGASMGGSILKDVATGFAGEALEEAAAEAIDPLLLNLFNIDENAEFSLANVAYAGLIGGLSGGLMTAGPAAINYKSAASTGRAIRESGETAGILAYAKNLAAGAERAKTKLVAEKGTKEAPAEGAGVIGKATTGVKNAVKGFRTGRAANSADKLAETVRKNVAAYEAMVKSPDTTPAILEKYDALLGELRGNLFLLENAYMAETYEAAILGADEGQKQELLQKVNQLAKEQGGKEGSYTAADLEKNTDGILTSLAGRLMMEEAYSEMFGKGKTTEDTTVQATPEAAKAAESPVEAEEAAGKQRDTEEGNEAQEAASSLWEAMKPEEGVEGFGVQNQNEEALLAAAMQNDVPKTSIPIMLDRYRAGTKLSPQEFAEGWADGVGLFGRFRLDEETISPETALGRMEEASRKAAVSFGRESSERERAAREAAADKRKVPAVRTDVKGKQQATRGTVKVERGIRISDDFSPGQYAAYKAADILSEALGTDIYIQRTLERDGRKVNGYYDADSNAIYININAVRDGKQIALYTLGHEVTHYIKEWSPDKFDALSDFVMKQLGKDAESAIDEKMASLRRVGLLDGKTVRDAYELAHEEVVADGMELVLTDGKVLDQLARTDKSLWERVKGWITDTIKKIKKAYASLNQVSKTAQVLRETMESLDEVERLFTEGVKEAGERTRTAGIEKKADTNERKLSVETPDNDNEISPDTYSDGSKYPSDVYAESLKDQFDDWMQGIMPDNGYFDLGMTPPVLVRNNAPKIPLIMLEDVVYKFTTDYGHEIAVEDVAKLPTEFNDPVFLFKGSRENSMVVVTDILDKSGDPVIVAIHLNKLQKRARVNRVASLYGKHNIENYVQSRIEAGDLIEASAEKAPAWFTNRGLQLPKLVQTMTDAYTDSIAQESDSVNRKFSISEENISEEGENPDVSENVGDKAMTWDEAFGNAVTGSSFRKALAEALEKTVKTDSEYKILKDYSDNIAVLNNMQKKIAELTATATSLREKQFYSPSKEERSAAAKKLQELYKERAKIEAEMAKGDSEIARLREMEPIQNLMRVSERRGEEKAEKKAQERAESKQATEDRRLLEKKLRQLYRRLFSPTKKWHIPPEMQEEVKAALAATNMETKWVTKVANLEAEIERLEALKGKGVDNRAEIERLEMELETALSERESLNEQMQFGLKLFELFGLAKSETVNSAFDAEVQKMLVKYRETVGDTPVYQMSAKQLEAANSFYQVLITRIGAANKLFLEGKEVELEKEGNKSITEVDSVHVPKGLKPRRGQTKLEGSLLKLIWDSLKPTQAFEIIGSESLLRVFRDMRKGEDVFAEGIKKAEKFAMKKAEDHNYYKWDHKTRRAFQAANGKTVHLTVDEMMTLYSLSKRPVGYKHITEGGTQFGKDALTNETFKNTSIPKPDGKLNDNTRYVWDDETLKVVKDALTDEQKAFADEMQQYLANMGKIGNEISLQLYGIELFNDPNYFPTEVSGTVTASQTGRTGDPKITNKSFTHQTDEHGATNPLILRGFMDVWVNHVNGMELYHAFAVPTDNMNKLLNYKKTAQKDADTGEWTGEAVKKMPSGSLSVKDALTSQYGDLSVKYIEQLLRDINGGARSDGAADLLTKGLSLFKKVSVVGSMSVVVQQPSSIGRAISMIRPKYVLNNKGFSFKNYSAMQEELEKYAKVAIIKDMGSFDTNVGSRTGDYIMHQEYKGIKDKAVALFKDSKYRNDAFGFLANKADQLAWFTLWEGCKREQSEKLGKPINSEAVLKAAGERFTDIVVHTQVYDSTLSRSQIMRSKDSGAQLLTAFMAEPTVTVNMLATGFVNYSRTKDGKALRNVIGSVMITAVLNSVLAALVYAARDDDEEQTYGEKYAEQLVGGLMDSANALTYFPYLRDIWSIVQGYEVERSDMAVISDLYNSMTDLWSDTKKPVDKVLDAGANLGSLFGLPTRNLVRDGRGLYNVLSTPFVEKESGSGTGTWNAVKSGFLSSFGIRNEITDGYQLYKAVLSGDEKHYNRVAARYEDEKAVEMALRTALRENDKRINEAAQARISGDLQVYESILSQIEGEGHFDRDVIIRAINNEINAINRAAEKESTVPRDEEAAAEAEEEASESLYKSSDLNEALARGDEEDFEIVYYSLLADKKEQGKTETQAKAAIKSSISAYWKKLYVAAWEANDNEEMKRIQAILLSTGLYGSRNDVAQVGQDWVKAYAASKTK